ncbi:hypothetical protein [Halobacterium wangiae]|uniref:hypothetical protein n=1 Tax=Halobacterium wangiae TaxID=2902623 RepID=UPI001E61AB23|nr:hypothetical protein [Halobacterium wangiae]
MIKKLHWLKTAVLQGGRPRTIRECRHCGTTVGSQRDACPECGTDGIACYRLSD